MGCLPVRGFNGLSYAQVDKHGITIITTYISVDLAHHEIFRAKVGKGGISNVLYSLRNLHLVASPSYIFHTV